MRAFDLDRIAEHRKTIQENLRQLDAARGRALDDFLNDQDALDAAKYRLQTVIQALMDSSNHICARLHIVTNQDTGECVRALQKQGFFSQEHATMYVKMIRFRNVLVHLYGEVDNQRVHEILENDLDYFRMFLMEIDAVVKKQEMKRKAKGKRQ